MRPIDPHMVQRLASAWRTCSFNSPDADGMIMYDRISMCAHSCNPCCCFQFGRNDTFVLRARIPLAKDTELTISYLHERDLLLPTVIRQQLLGTWDFQCTCE